MDFTNTIDFWVKVRYILLSGKQVRNTGILPKSGNVVGLATIYTQGAADGDVPYVPYMRTRRRNRYVVGKITLRHRGHSINEKNIISVLTHEVLHQVLALEESIIAGLLFDFTGLAHEDRVVGNIIRPDTNFREIRALYR